MMKRCIYWIFLFYPFCLLLGGADDTQLWIKSRFVRELNPCLYVHYDTEVRFDKEIQGFALRYDELVWTWKTSRCWDIGFGVRQIFQRDNNGDLEAGPRALIEFTKNWEITQHQWSNRTRIEYRKLEEEFILRNRFKVILPRQFTQWKLSPSLKEEIFLKDMKELNEFRLNPGLKKTISNDVAVELGYIWLLRKTNETWYGSNVLHFELEVNF